MIAFIMHLSSCNFAQAYQAAAGRPAPSELAIVQNIVHIDVVEWRL
jgi:hypothetical protein